MAGTATHQIAVLGAVGKGHLSLDALAEHLPITRKAAGRAAAKLVLRGFLSRADKGLFALTQLGIDFLAEGKALKCGPRRPLEKTRNIADTLRQRLWRAMRLTGRFTIPDLLTLAVLGTEKQPRDSAQHYVRQLRLSGYLAELPQPTGAGHKIYRLIKDTGQRAPVWSKGQMVDMNEGVGSNG